VAGPGARFRRFRKEFLSLGFGRKIRIGVKQTLISKTLHIVSS
jgi:hypothetical protein